MPKRKKTRPILPSPQWSPTLPTSIPGIYLRLMRPSDLEDFHELRTQPEVMKWTSKARVDADLDETRTWLRRFVDLDEELEESSQILDEVGDEYNKGTTKDEGELYNAYMTNQSKMERDESRTATGLRQDDKPKETIRSQRSPSLNFAIVCDYYQFNNTINDNQDSKSHGQRNQVSTTQLSTPLPPSRHTDPQHQQSITASETPVIPSPNQASSSKSQPTKQKVIGAIGCHHTHPQAELGYMIRREFWGLKITTAALKTYLDLWWSLEREIITVDDRTDDDNTKSNLAGRPSVEKDDDEDGDDDGEEETEILPEVIKAEIEVNNIASRRLLERYGFVYDCGYRVMENGLEVELGVYYLRRKMIA